MATAVNEQLLDERLAKLEKARTWSPRLLSKLENHIRTADDEALFRINPFTFAREKNLNVSEVIDLLLHATSLSLFEMDWQLLCKQCSCVVESFGGLKGVHKFLPFLTGKRLLTTQAFRDLFRSEVIQASEGIGVRDISLLFTDLEGSTALYDRIGDLNAFSLVQRHFEHLQAVTQRFNGAIIKTIGDAVMAAFLTPLDAMGAALAMRSEIAAFNGGRPDRAPGGDFASFLLAN